MNKCKYTESARGLYLHCSPLSTLFDSNVLKHRQEINPSIWLWSLERSLKQFNNRSKIKPYFLKKNNSKVARGSAFMQMSFLPTTSVFQEKNSFANPLGWRAQVLQLMPIYATGLRSFGKLFIVLKFGYELSKLHTLDRYFFFSSILKKESMNTPIRCKDSSNLLPQACPAHSTPLLACTGHERYPKECRTTQDYTLHF